MNELGKAYVQIIPSAKGISGGISKVIAPEAAKAGTNAGHIISSNLSGALKGIGGGLKSVGAGLTNSITKPALVAGAALSGSVLFAGWNRMTQIDEAKAKLSALGNSAGDVKDIMNNASDAVKGTSYGMNEAATVAASAVAAGVEPGKKLTSYLTQIGDAAAVAGTDMGSMGAIFNKVAASNKAQNDVLSQLADRGIPIYQLLGKQLGKTQEEVFEMASNGEIDLKTFQSAIESGMSGAAKAIGSSTITGAISNVKASISRIGANFLGDASDENSFAGKILPLLNDLLDNKLPIIEEKAKIWGAKFADIFAEGIGKIGEIIPKITGFISSIPLPVLGSLAGALLGAGPALTIVGGIVSKIGAAMPVISTIASVLGTSVMGLIGPIVGVAAAFALVWAKSEAFRGAVINLVQKIGSALAPVIKTASGIIKVLIREVMNIATAIGNALAPVIKLLTPIVVFLVKVIVTKFKLLAPVIKAVIRTVSAVIQAAAAIIQGVATGIGRILSSAWNFIKNNARKVWNGIKTAITVPIKAVEGIIKGVISGIKNAFKVFSSIAGGVKSVFGKVKEAICSPIDKAKSIIKKAIGFIKDLFPLKLGKIFSGIKLPHFKISGGKVPWGIGGAGEAPSVGVEWYQKAEANPYMFKGATLFGAGEHNDEVLYGRSALMNDIEKATSSKGNTYNFNVTVSGADDPEDWADRFVRRLKMQTRMV